MRTSVLAALVALPTFAGAQIPIRNVGPAEAISKDTVSFLYGVREISDGRVLVNDAASRRLMLFDASLGTARIVADSTAATRMLYGKNATGIIPYLGDSTLLIDLATRALLVVDPDGRVPRVMSPPRPGDIGFMWNPSIGTPRFDAAGRLIYRTWLMPAFKAPEPGKPFVTPAMPDSAPLIRADFETRRADTLAWIGIPRTRLSAVALPGGGVTVSMMINPVAFVDDWTALPDGSVAVLRGRDYHIDWINADGTRWSSPKMPFDWKRLTDEEKVALIDSTKKAIERLPTAATPQDAGPHGGGGSGGHSMTIVGVVAGDGGPAPQSSASVTPAPPRKPEVVGPSELPDYMPPVMRSGTMKADLEGNVWILPSTSAQSAGGLLYDVINRKGELFQRVRLPLGRALEGFGKGGVIYMTSHDANGARLERARIK